MSGTTAKKSSKKSTAKRSAHPSTAALRASSLDTTGAVAPLPSSGADERYAPSVWGQGAGTTIGEDLVCPSGQTALVIRPGVQGLIEAGVLQNVDSLTSIVNSKHISRAKGKPQVDPKTILNDPKAMADIITVVDRVLVHVVKAPQLTLAWTELADGTKQDLNVEERQALSDLKGRTLVFTDQVDLDDKMFIFNFAVGGTRGLDRFREQAAELVDGVDDEPVAADETQ